MKYGKTIPFITDMDRTNAIILLNGTIYESEIDHQCCIEDAISDVFTKNEWDINNEADKEKAIAYTDSAFRNNEMFGFDVYWSVDEQYLVAHYPQNLEVAACYEKMKQYAEENNLVLATFTDRDKLGIECRVVL